MDRTIRAKMFERSLIKKAQSGGYYFQRDPATGKYRGIIEYTDDKGVVNFIPEKPVVGRDLNQLKRQLESIVEFPLEDKGMSEPWYPESNMPFDVGGNRVG